MINSITISFILLINLVLLHSLSASFELRPMWFYVPKIVFIVPIFTIMFVWQYFDFKIFKDRIDDQLQLKTTVKNNFLKSYNLLLLIVMILYFLFASYYSFLAIKIPSREDNEKRRFSLSSITMTLILTTATALIVVLPFESKVL